MRSIFQSFIIATVGFSFSFSFGADIQRLSHFVNPMIGASTSQFRAGSAHGMGKTFPGATTPFGLVQVSPNTITGGDNGSGYSDEHTTIEGFAFTQMSGVGWYGDLGNFLVMPTTGALQTSAGRISHPEEGYRSRYDKATEQAQAGYYSVMLTDMNVKAEATAAPHSGILRFTFPKHNQSRIQIDLARRVGGTSTEQYVRVVDHHTIEGWMRCTPDGGGWGNGGGQANYTVYFCAQFSKPLKTFGVWSADIPDNRRRKRQDIESQEYQRIIAQATIYPNCREFRGKHLGFYTEFPTTSNEPVLVKAGISFTSLEGARLNLATEIPHFDFDRIRESARYLWDKALGKILIRGGQDEDKHIFYTALYHTMIDPRNFTDVNGEYPGGDGKIHRTANYTRRTVFSGWDVFRSQYPLLTIINPEVVNDTLNSLIELADETNKHYLERWEFLNAYSGCMIGNPAVSVMADAYAKGIRRFDIDKGYQYAVNTCERFGNGTLGYTPGSISETLEYAYSEWCLSQLAGALGHQDDAKKYLARSKSYQNIFDPEHKWFRPKQEDGSWHQWPKDGRLVQNYGCIESNPYQQGWFVPHDIEGLVSLLGGKEAALKDLDHFFAHVPDNMLWNDYYNHPNEPVHHVPFLFNRLGAPWKTQYWTRRICDKAYHNSVEGLVGNEDVGQMSAWYVLASIGLHPVCPGDPHYEITSPVFDEVIIQLPSQYAQGQQFTIRAHNQSPKNHYIQSAKLNGVPWDSCRISHTQIMAGGLLELEMGPQPNTFWGDSSPTRPQLKDPQPGHRIP